MRILRGKWRDKNCEENLVTEANELKSISKIIMWAEGVSFMIASFTSAAFFIFLAAITILTPFFANTLAVSAPIPDVAPIYF